MIKQFISMEQNNKYKQKSTKGLSLQSTSNSIIKLPKLKEEIQWPSPKKISPNKEKDSPRKSIFIKKLQSCNYQREIQLVKQIPVNYEGIKSKSWLLCRKQPYSIIKSFNGNLKRQVASLTKMMTFIATLRIAKKFNIDILNTYLRVTLTAIDVTGTMAQLQLGEWITINDLLYGLMLPSGNDAANVLAENIGALIFFDTLRTKTVLTNLKSIDLSEDYSNIKLYVDFFVKYMNSIAKQLCMKDTNFMNAHGLSHKQHLSTAQDMAILTNHLLTYQQAIKVVSTKRYEARIKISNHNQLSIRILQWYNTNKLIDRLGFRGVKTGHTPSAGGCLSSYYSSAIGNNLNEQLIIIVLGSRNQEERFSDTEAILQHYKKGSF